jgi:hypothetical protein
MPDLQSELDRTVARGRKEAPEFDQHSSMVMGLAAAPNDLRQALIGLGPEAHRAISRLADDPEAERIFSMRGLQLGAELGRYVAKIKPKVQEQPEGTAAPARSVVDPFDPATPMPEYAAKRASDQKAQRERQPKGRDVYTPDISMDDYTLLRARQDAARRKARRAH